MKFIRILLTLCFSLSGLVQAASPTFLLEGDKDGKYFNDDDYCENFYVEDVGGRWVPTERSDLHDKHIDSLRACICYTGSPPITSVLVKINAASICKMEARCAQYYDDVRKQGICIRPYSVPKQGTARSEGYYLCTSNFAKVNLFGGGFDTDNPIDLEKLRKALQSPELISKAASIIEKRFDLQYERASRLPNCGDCKQELRAANFIFENFYDKAGVDRLITLAEKYVRYDANMTLPAWISKRIPEASQANLKSNAEEYWKDRYQERLAHVSTSDSKLEDIRSFIQDFDVVTPSKWSQIDFSNQLPKMKLVLEAKEKQRAQQAEAEQVIAEKEAKRLAEQVAKEEKLRKEQEAKAAKAFAAQVEVFRKTLKVGSDTHC